MPAAKAHASTILAEFEKAQAELVGRAVVLTDGKAGTVENLWLDELHGIRLSIRGHDGKWPVATVKFVAARAHIANADVSSHPGRGEGREWLLSLA